MKPSTSLYIGVLICFLLSAVPNTGTSQTTDAPEAIELYRSAGDSFEAQEFTSAIRDYQSLLESHPEFTRQRDARFYKGMAHYYLQDYSAAASELGYVRDSLADLTAYQHSEKMLIYLAFCQHQAAKAVNATAPQQGIENALASFDQFLSKFPKSELTPQAWFFKGQALEDWSRVNPGSDGFANAVNAYQRVIDDYPKSNLQTAAKFAMGKCFDAMADYPNAAKTYQAYLNEFPNDPKAEEVRLRWANTLLQQGLAIKQSGNSEEAKGYFEQADGFYQSLIDNPRYPARVDAMNQKAYGRLLIEDYKSAADLYAQIANDHPDFEFADEAALNAGKYYFTAGNIPLAEKWLSKVADSEVEHGPEATHWLCRIAIEQDQFPRAIQLSKAQLETNPGNQTSNLQMDMADAMFRIPARQKEAVALYASIAKANQGQSLAAKASYYAAFGYLRLNEPKAALAAAENFQKLYPQSEFLPDTLEILGQAASTLENYSLAKSTFESLVSQFPNHAREEWWQTRIAMADLQSQNYAAAIAYLSPAIEKLENPQMIAEAQSILSSCHMELENYGQAINAIDKAIKTDPERADIHRLQLKKARALAEQKESPQAFEIAQEVWKNHNDLEAAFLLGELSAEMNNHQQAIEYYREAAPAGSQHSWRPRSLLGISSSFVQLNQPTEALQTIKGLRETYPDHKDSQDAILVRAKAHRMAGDIEKALADVDRFLQTQPNAAKRFHAAYVKSLCQSDSQAWASVIETLTPLTQDLSVNQDLADDVIFYLAWAHQKNDQEAQALELFDLLCDSFKESVHAAEANYHLGQSHYQREQYGKAIGYFETALDANPTELIGERAAYRLAWSFYQLADYQRSLNAFKHQTDKYPEGPLNPVGLSMLAESHFQLSQHDKAFKVFKVAIPAIESSEIQNNLRVLGPVHAAQSANQIQDFQAAMKYANLVIDNHSDSPLIADAWFERGMAENSTGQIENAEASWQQAMQLSLGETGAKARCKLGQLYYQQKEFESAAIQFKLVMNGYGGLDSTPPIKKWQALAAYEAARCYYAQSATSNDTQTRRSLVQQTISSFEWLVSHFPDSPLAAEATKQIQRLSDPPQK